MGIQSTWTLQRQLPADIWQVNNMSPLGDEAIHRFNANWLIGWTEPERAIAHQLEERINQ